MNELKMTRRNALLGLASAAVVLPSTLAAQSEPKSKIGGIHAIPELAPQWKALDLAEILSRPAAYCSVSQNKSCYDPGGVQSGEMHRQRGSLEATIKVVHAARKAANFISFNWIGYEVFRQHYPMNEFDKAQFGLWTKGLNWTEEQQSRDAELVEELRALVRPGDNEFFEKALQTAFIGTQMPLELSHKRVEVIVFTGIHLDWCIEGNARLARDNGYLPIVIGDACGCQKPEQEAAAMERINNFFAPVISADHFVQLLNSRHSS
ncbi:cysteine hydrolase [Klebsiella variicola]|uniref:cysteine hydrolase n=1 Tax=Klebsiella variicola TaxID=244366 RepID=UPI001F31ECF7|nr:cysteine hydrolase [Klebsiella variicola]MDF7641807.1 cysteine hydrolase [Klebsiella variicola]